MRERISLKYYLIGPLIGFSVLEYEILTNKSSCVYRQDSGIIKNEISEGDILESRVLKTKFEDDITLLAKLIWGESRGESKEIKRLVFYSKEKIWWKVSGCRF